MPFETHIADRVLHLLLFVAAGVFIGVSALGVIERLADGGRRLVRMWHVLTPLGAFLVLLAAERTYHAFA